MHVRDSLFSSEIYSASQNKMVSEVNFFKYSVLPKIKWLTKRIEYILEWNLLEKCVKRPFCCTVSILHVCFTYLCYITFWALEHHLIEN